jgi:putative ABC transport system permease protein
MMKNKIFSFINIFGLSIGLTCCMLITLYILNELNYDSYQKNAANLYQLGTTFLIQGKENKMANTPAPMGETMKHVLPEIQETTRLAALFAEDKTLFQYKGKNGDTKSFYESNGLLADSTFFRMFTYDFIEGNPHNALANPNTIVVSEEIARKIFGSEPALNKVIHISSSSNGDHDFLVTGVFRPMPNPSHIDGRFFMSMMGGTVESFIKDHKDDLASNNMYYTYLLLKNNANAKKLEAKFPAFIDQYAGKSLKAMGYYRKQFLVPVRDIHLHSGMTSNVTAPGSVTYLYILASIAVFTLLIACINFMNLSTARSSKRSSEVGIRKVLGAEKKSLISQFLGESIFMSVIAFGFALAFSKLLIPAFNEVSGKDLSLSLSENIPILLSFLLLSVFTGLLAGSYPAFFLSSFKPIKVLKGRFSNSLAATSLRKVLVVFQFIISVILIIASVIISSQMSFLRSKNLGFDKDHQLVVALRSQTAKNIYKPFKSELLKEPMIANIGAGMFYPGISNPMDNLFYKEGENMQQAKITRMNFVDNSYLQTLNIQPIAGRIFSEQFPADTNRRIILNEKGVEEIGFRSAKESIGKKIYFDWQGKNYAFEIIGVVKDFHYEDLHSAITPYAFELSTDQQFNYIIIHTKTGDISKLLQSIRTSWQHLNPGEPFEYSFLDEDFQKNYVAENHLSSVVRYFTFVAIFISCLGLFGLATFSAEQRVKEIGVRKVLGASVMSIVALLSKDFLKLVGIAIIIASPLAWYVMRNWLNDFAYRIDISWQVFLVTTFIALFIALFTIGFQAIRAAAANPVKSLRTE